MSDSNTAAGLVELPDALRTQLAAWRDALQNAAAPGCLALYVHGSALTSRYDPARSDINLLVVLDEFPAERLHALGTAFAAQAKAKGPRVTPLVLTLAQIRSASDVFPVEFMDLARRRALLAGSDVLGGLRIEPRNLRLQCESELRSKLVGMRQAYLLHGGAPGTARELLVRAAGGSAAVLRGLLELRGERPPEAAEDLVNAVASAYHVDAAALAGPFTARHETAQWAEDAARAALGRYIAALDALIQAVDALAVD